MAVTNATHELLRLRLLVAALGERLSKPWWRTQFLTPTGQRYMERVFPRRSLPAGMESATIAARRDHDANVGTRSYHLFRLPPHLEDQLAETVAEHGLDSVELGDGLNEVLENVIQLGSGASLPSGSGPKSLGSVKEVLKPAPLASLAALYAKAAQEGTRIYPYFEAGSDE